MFVLIVQFTDLFSIDIISRRLINATGADGSMNTQRESTYHSLYLHENKGHILHEIQILPTQ